VFLSGVHHIEGGEVDAADGAAPATDAAMRLREEPEIIGVDAETRIQGAKGRAKTLPFVFWRSVLGQICLVPKLSRAKSGRCALAATAATAYLDKAQVVPR
jgi:hypothetical protein